MRALILGGIVLAGALGLPGGQGSSLPGHVASLQKAKSFRAEFSVIKAGGSPQKGTLVYGRPGKFRIETPERLTVSDGSTQWDLNKSTNAYTEGPAGAKRWAEEDVWAWAAFFDAEVLAKAGGVSSKPKRTMRGAEVQEWSFSLPGDTSVTVFLDTKLGIARGATVKKGAVETLTLATTLVSDGPTTAADFSFVPPAGAKKIIPPPADAATFAKVNAIFTRSCVGCHGNNNPKGGYAMTTHAQILRGGRAGAAVIPGDAANSILLQYIKGTRQPQMPRNAAPLGDADVKLIEKWISEGAKSE